MYVGRYGGGFINQGVYPPYVFKNQADCGHHLVVLPKNEVHVQVGQLNPGSPGVGQHMVEREKKRKYFGHGTQNFI